MLMSGDEAWFIPARGGEEADGGVEVGKGFGAGDVRLIGWRRRRTPCLTGNRDVNVRPDGQRAALMMLLDVGGGKDGLVCFAGGS
jgi:hypothetical protein